MTCDRCSAELISTRRGWVCPFGCGYEQAGGLWSDPAPGVPEDVFAELSPPYSTIVADPPWMYQKRPGSKGGGAGAPGIAEALYGTMTNEEIAALPVARLAATDAHLFIWVTNPGMFGGRFSTTTPAEIAHAWGFEYRTMLTWVKVGDSKEPIGGGMGWYFRGCTEHVLYATRGRASIAAEVREPNVLMARRSGHSEKPAAFLDLVERVSPGPYVELFARAPRLGWDSWGHGFEIGAVS